MSGHVFTVFPSGSKDAMSFGRPDSRFSNLNGGHADVSSLRMSASCPDRGEMDPLDRGHAYAHCLLLSCELTRSCPESAFLAAVVSRTQTFPQMSSYQSRLWDSGASNPSAALEVNFSSKAAFHDEPLPVGLRLHNCVFAVQARPSQSHCTTETEKDTQDSHGCHQGQARRVHGESHGKC